MVLTAAHCTTYTTPYFVKVGAESLNDQTAFTQVSAVWTSPRYNPKTFINDVGLLKLTERFEDIKFPTLASPKIAKSINKFSKLQIFGWGLDQNEDLAELLRVSNLTIQDSLATKAFGKYFNAKTMISAGRKIPAENVWSGACSGDSGGPLLSQINSINVIVGITSWGAKNCVPNKPSIFARVSYYEADIKNGIKALETQSKVVDRSAPVATIEPALIGQAKPGSSLKCSAGSWKNALAITSTWISPARINGSTNTDVLVQTSDGSSVFKCEVIISSAKASVRRVLTTSITGSAVTTSNPVISGIPSSLVKSGTTARCEGWNWRSPVDNERVTWFTSSSSQPTVPVNGRQIGSGSSITLDSSLLRGENGRYLICQVTGVKDGFESHFTASKYLTTPSAPTISYVSISAYSLTSGSSATCSFTSYSEAETTRIDWGYTSVAGYFTQYSGLSGEQIQLTRDLAQQAAGKYLACRVTLSNSGGEVSKSANTYNTFASLPNAPTVNAYISGSIVAGSIARCSADSGYNYGSNFTYAWGKTSSSGSRLIEGQVYSRSTSYTLTSSTLDELAGAFLTCVVTLENTAGSVSSASSISIPNNKTIVPQPTSPSVEAQTASSASISVKIRVPAISGYDSNKMIAKLNVVNAPNCTNLTVNPGLTYDCAGLSANTTYTANVSVSSSTGQLITNTSSNVSFTTIGLGSLQTPSAPTFTPISPTEVRVALPGIPGFNANTMNASLYIYYQTSLSALGIDGSASTVIVKELASGKTHTGYIVLRSLTNGSEVKSPVITFTLPTNSALAACTGGTDRTPGLPQCLMPENLPGTTWNEVLNSTGVVINGAVCSPSVCGVNGSWRTARNMNGKSTPNGYPELSTYIQSPTSGASWGKYYTNGVYETSSGQIYQPGSTIPTNSSALNPTFSSVTSTADGFTFQITNYNSAYTWSTYVEATSQPGAGATVSSSGLVTVSGMTSGASATIIVRTSRTGYEAGTNLIAGTSLNSTANQLKMLISDPDSSGISNISFCFTNPSVLSGSVSWTSPQIGSGSFLKHSGTPACPSPAGVSVGQRLIPGTTYTFSVSASNSGRSYSDSITFTTPGDTRAPEISAASVSPSSISVGQNIIIGFRATDLTGVSSCKATVYNSNNIDVVTNSTCTRVSGNATDGVWQVSINMNSGNNPGSYSVRASATDTSGNSSPLTSVGSFSILGPLVSNLGTLPIPRTIGINYVDQIVLNGFDLGNFIASPGNYTWAVRVENSAGSIVTSQAVGSNQTYITGLSSSTTYKVYLVATDYSGGTKLSTALTITTLAPAWTPPANLSTPIYDDTYTRICLTQNWTNCGNWTIYNEVGTVVNRLVGPIPFTFCQTSGVNVCSGTPKGYAVLTGQYYAPIDTELPKLASNSGSITSASMSQGALGISTNSNFTVNFRATDDIGVTVANMVLDTSCCENVVQRIFLSTFANLTSGTSKDGVYSATALFPGKTEMQSLKQSWNQGGTEDSMKGCGKYYIRIMLSDAKNHTSWLTLGTINVVRCSE